MSTQACIPKVYKNIRKGLQKNTGTGTHEKLICIMFGSHTTCLCNFPNSSSTTSTPPPHPIQVLCVRTFSAHSLGKDNVF